MLSSEAGRMRNRGGLLAAAALAAVLAIGAGCTARPLYGEVSPTAGSVMATAQLASVEIKPAHNRVGQEVRNHLIFLFGGGAGQPANPAYSMDLNVTAYASNATSVSTPQVKLEPTAGFVAVQGTYRVTDTATGELVSSGTRSVQAAYDIPAQNFAAQRAVRDAENRGARELAELLRLVVAQELTKATSRGVPDIVTSPEDLDRRRAVEETGVFRPRG